MHDRLPDNPIPTRNGVDAGRTPAISTESSSLRGFFLGFAGALLALVLVALLGAGIYFGLGAVHRLPGSKVTTAGADTPAEKSTNPLNDPSTWALSQEPAQNLSGDGNADIGWWTRTFDLPTEAKVTNFLKDQGLDVSRVVPLHYNDAPEATTITYQVDAVVPAALYRVPRATWVPANPEMKPFASLLVLNHDLPAGQFWNTQQQTIATEAGAKLDFAWKLRRDKSGNTVTANRLPGEEGVFTQPQAVQLQAETEKAVAQLQARIQTIDARVDGDVQAKLAAVAADPPRPALRYTQWNSGDGSGEPTKSGERIGGGAAAGAAGGAAFGAAAGDAGLGAGIGAGVGLLGGIIYDAVSKDNDRERYRRRVAAENAEKLSEWRDQLKALKQQRAQIQQDGVTEKQQALQDLASAITAANGHLDGITAPINPEPTTISDAPAAQPTANQPSGPIR